MSWDVDGVGITQVVEAATARLDPARYRFAYQSQGRNQAPTIAPAAAAPIVAVPTAAAVPTATAVPTGRLHGVGRGDRRGWAGAGAAAAIGAAPIATAAAPAANLGVM
jgi:hypothetical protein